MQDEITIAHLTDIHIGPSTNPIRDIDVRRHFINTLRNIETAAPDLIVLGGDQAARDGELEAYEWIKPHLDQTGIHYTIIPGNHDSIHNLVQVFNLGKDLKSEELYYIRNMKGFKLVFMDSSREIVSENQLEWLRAETGDPNSPVLLFIHHPPLFCNCTFMDRKYPLKNRDLVFDLMCEQPSIAHIFCGHYHTEKTIRDRHKNIYLTPSTMMQMDPDKADYAISATNPGWRFIRWNGLRMETSVRYIEQTAPAPV